MTGTTQHIETSWKAFPSVFKFFEDKLYQRLGATSRLGRSQSAPTSQQGKNGAISDLPRMHASLPPSLATVKNSSEVDKSKTDVQDEDELSSTLSSTDLSDVGREKPMSQDQLSPRAIENSDRNEPVEPTAANRNNKGPVENEDPMDDPGIKHVEF